MLFSCTSYADLRQEETILKRLLVFATVLVLLALMVSSVSANVTQTPPSFPDGAASVSAEEGIASPILFLNGAASGAVRAENVFQNPPIYPDSVPTDEFSLNGGSTISVIVSS